MKTLCALALVLAAATACKTEVAATVECKVSAGPSVECSILQTKGTTEIEVCWDFNVRCANDATLEAHGNCGTVKDGTSSAVTIPTEKLTITGSCEGETSAEVVNIKLKAT